jgi:hypothetical protein
VYHAFTTLLCTSSLSCCRWMRRILEFQWFLIALSVRPGSIWAILAHLVPIWDTWQETGVRGGGWGAGGVVVGVRVLLRTAL